MTEDFERVERALDIAEKVSAALSNIISVFFSLALLSDLLGINIFELVKTAVTKPQVVPTEWIQAYYPVWYAMEWALWILINFDIVYTNHYMHKHKTAPPVIYVKWMSMAMFFVSFWLFAVFRAATFAAITVMSAVSLSYAWFVKSKEVATV